MRSSDFFLYNYSSLNHSAAKIISSKISKDAYIQVLYHYLNHKFIF